MRPSLWITFSFLLLALPGCGETFTAAGGGGGSGGSGAATSSQGGGGAGAQGGGGSSVSAGGATTCAAQGSDECQMCLADACADSYCACGPGTGCEALLDCYSASPVSPPSAAYLQACWQKNASGIASAGNLLACGGEACSQSCSLPPVDACTTCLYESCPDQVNACFSLYECTALLKCLGDCAPDDGSCAGECAVDHQAGAQPASALDSCGKASCTETCK